MYIEPLGHREDETRLGSQTKNSSPSLQIACRQLFFRTRRLSFQTSAPSTIAGPTRSARRSKHEYMALSPPLLAHVEEG